MFINDIEFIDSLGEKDRRSNFSIKGGASAVANAYTGTNDGEVSAVAYTKATGTQNRSSAKTKVKTLSRKKRDGTVYTISYSVGYGAAYGVDRNGSSFDKDFSKSFSIH